MNRKTAVEVLGFVLLLTGLAGLYWEMYGGGDFDRGQLTINVVVALAGMFFITPARTRELVGLVGAYIPVPGGRRPADPPAVAASPVAPPVPFTATLPPQMREASPHALHYPGVDPSPEDVGEPDDDPNVTDARRAGEPGAL